MIVLDTDGSERWRSVGFLPPEEMAPALLQATAEWHFCNDRYEEATESVDRILKEYPDSARVPAALYMRGVCRFEMTQDGRWLKEVYDILNSRYPNSIWAKKAQPYRLLKTT